MGEHDHIVSRRQFATYTIQQSGPRWRYWVYSNRLTTRQGAAGWARQDHQYTARQRWTDWSKDRVAYGTTWTERGARRKVRRIARHIEREA